MVLGHRERHADLDVKIILLGDYSVGKSSLLRVLERYNNQVSEERGTVTRSLVRSNLQPGGFVDVEFTHQDKTVLARIADTGGQERYRSMTSSYFRGAHGCLLLFDVTKEESFGNLDTWIESIDLYKSCDAQLPCILVGNRCKSPARRILYDRAAEYAESRGLPYMELDMEHMNDVRRVFEALLDSVTVNLSNRSPIAISIRPSDLSSTKDVWVQKNVICHC